MFEKVVSRTDPLPLVESQVVAYPQARIPVFKKEKKPNGIKVGKSFLNKMPKEPINRVNVGKASFILTGCMPSIIWNFNPRRL